MRAQVDGGLDDRARSGPCRRRWPRTRRGARCGVSVRRVPSGRASTIERTWAPKLPVAWWSLPWTSSAMAPPMVTLLVPGVTWTNQPCGTIARSRSSSDVPASTRAVPARWSSSSSPDTPVERRRPGRRRSWPGRRTSAPRPRAMAPRGPAALTAMASSSGLDGAGDVRGGPGVAAPPGDDLAAAGSLRRRRVGSTSSRRVHPDGEHDGPGDADELQRAGRPARSPRAPSPAPGRARARSAAPP